MAETSAHIAENIAKIRQDIVKIAAECGRDAAAIELIAISKFHPIDAVTAAIAAGHYSFGENRVQEAMGKFSDLRINKELSTFVGAPTPAATGVDQGRPVESIFGGLSHEQSVSTPRLRLHLVGSLQSNKAREAAQFFDEIHSLDRLSLAREFCKIREQGIAIPNLYIQINSGEEPQKSGIIPVEADDFIHQCRDEFQLPIIGLMCVPPVNEPAALHFALVAEMAKRHGLSKLSMGMSHDFAEAIRFGATAIRIGTAIFGVRNPSPPTHD